MTLNVKKKLVWLGRDAGIAIGPILFIIAVLGILASAIAAGSGSFSNSTTSQSSGTKAAALIDIGQTMKFGFDRVMGEQSVAVTGVGVNVLDTTSLTSLFSPSGGGQAPPALTMGLLPTVKWLFPLVAVPGIGTTSGSRLAVLQVDAGTCQAVNTKANGLTTPGTATAIGDFGGGSVLSPAAANWLGASALGISTGCVYNSSAVTNGGTGTGVGATGSYYFYQVLGMQ